jgi:hypothetical protein
MRLENLKDVRRPVTAALIAFAVLLLVAPRAAEAGCNHLVISQSDRNFGFNRLDALIVGGPITAALFDEAHDRLPQPAPERRTPCSGPSCSNRVPLPVSTSTPGSSGFDQWAAPSGAALGQASAPSASAIAEPAPRPVVRKPSIFHPPPA